MDTQELNTQELIRTLKIELQFSDLLATAFVRARGRCEYCGADLLMARQGYASMQLDHLLPKSKYPNLENDLNNGVLCCSTCNGVKKSHDLRKLDESEEDILTKDREMFIDRCRKFIAEKMIAKYDDNWRKATELMQDLWWSR